MKWPVMRFENVTADTRNGLYKHGDFYGRGTRILKMFNLRDGGLNLERVDEVELDPVEAKAFALEPGDILMNRVNTPELVGKCAVIPEGFGPAVFESKNIRIRVRREVAEPAFFARYFSSPAGRPSLTQGVKHAIGMATLNNGDLRSCAVPVPPLSEQRRIVKLLEQADALRRQRAEADALAARILPALFRKMFCDPARNSMNLPEVTLESVADTTSGGTPDRSNPEYFGGTIPWVKSGELKGDVITTTEETITELGLQDSAAKKLPAGTILLALYGATVGAIAKLGITAATNQAVCCITPKADIDGEYLLGALSLLTPTLLARRVGGAQPNISQQIVRKLRLPLPPRPQQQRFAAHAVLLREQTRQRKLSRESLDTLFQTMVHLAFTGELTARWREAHMKELLAEMEQQAKALGLSSTLANV